MKTIHAIFEKGIFRPTEPVELPESCRVEFTPKIIGNPDDPGHLERVHDLLSQRFRSGRHDIAERHNEHQP